MDDPSFEERLIEEAPQEGLEILSIGFSLRELKEKLGDEAHENDEYIRIAVEGADKLAEVFSRFCSNEELASFLPQNAKRREVADEFTRRGAKAIAKLCI